MKKVSWLAAFVLILTLPTSVLLFSGCSEDAKDDNNSATITFGDLTPQEQEDVAETIVESSVTNVEAVQDLVAMMESGDFSGIGYLFDIFFMTSTPLSPEFPKNLPKSLASPPDTVWNGPDTQGWYEWSESETYEGTEISFTYRIRFTPDIWDDAHASDPVTSVETDYEYTMSDPMYGGLSFSGQMNVSMNTARTHVSGSSQASVSFTGITAEAGTGSFSSSATWTDVAVDAGDYSGEFDVDLNMSLTEYDGATPIETNFVFASVFSFNSDGSGTGASSIAGEEVIRYVFDAVTVEWTRSGYYTLATDNFVTHYPFTISV